MVTFVKVYRLTVKSVTCLFLQIFLPIVRGQHCYMHCFNFANKRADYLSCTASLIHENVAKKDCEALMEEMYKVEKLAYKTTKNTRLYCIKHNFELVDSDNLLFAMYFMESYSGKEFSEIQNLVSDWPPFHLL